MEKEFVVKRDSWHYRVNRFTSEGSGYWLNNWLLYEATFCSYFWRTTWSLIAMIVLFAMLAAGLGGLIWLGVTFPLELGKAILAVLGTFVGFVLLLLGIVLLSCIPGWIKLGFRKTVSSKEPGFVGMKYHAFKNKYCPRLAFEK